MYIRQRQNIHFTFEASRIFVQDCVLLLPVKCSLQWIAAEGKSDVEYDDDDDDDSNNTNYNYNNSNSNVYLRAGLAGWVEF
jgi:hypothetical protein